MKRILICILILLLNIQVVHAEPYIIVNVDDDEIIESQDLHEIRSIASTTKIMTCLVALEYGDFNDVLVVDDVVDQAWGSSIYLKEGQEASLRSLLYGLMLKSGNDASLVIAQHVAGSEADFVKLMNDKAAELGMFNTTFNNPHGLDVGQKGNYSTVYDMALLMKAALQNEMLVEIISTHEYTSEWGDKWHNSNQLLESFTYMIGGKTGFTNLAGRTFVSAAQKNGAQYIIVTFNMENRFEFHQEKYIQVMNEREKYTLIGIQDIEYDEQYTIHIDKPFEIVATQEEFEEGELTTYLSKSSLEYIVQWNHHEHQEIEIYDVSKKFCIWGWCFE